MEPSRPLEPRQSEGGRRRPFLHRIVGALRDTSYLPRHYASRWEWMGEGLRRCKWGILAALIAAYAWLGLALWLVVVGAVVGAAVVVVAAAQASPVALWFAPYEVVVGAIGGAVGTLLAFYGVLFSFGLPSIVLTLAGGFGSAALLVLIIAAFEPQFLQLRGYRRMSRRERARLARRPGPEPGQTVDALGLLQEEDAGLLVVAARRLELTAVPQLLVDDSKLPGAWTHLRTVVVTRALLQLPDEQVAAVLAHELAHWARGHVVGLRLCWACGLPVTVAYDVSAFVTRYGGTAPALFAWLAAWPCWVLIKFLIVPTMAADMRRNEYEADAIAKAAGFGPGLSAALTALSVLEPGRTGWETVVAATHPPTELRLEALEELSGHEWYGGWEVDDAVGS